MFRLRIQALVDLLARGEEMRPVDRVEFGPAEVLVDFEKLELFLLQVIDEEGLDMRPAELSGCGDAVAAGNQAEPAWLDRPDLDGVDLPPLLHGLRDVFDSGFVDRPKPVLDFDDVDLRRQRAAVGDRIRDFGFLRSPGAAGHGLAQLRMHFRNAVHGATSKGSG